MESTPKSEQLTRYLVRPSQWKVREVRVLAGKNPFGPEEKTAPSTRNPILEARPTRPAVAVVEAPAAAKVVRRAPPPAPPTPEFTARLTDDAVGPSTPRPRVSLEAVPRIVANAARIRSLPIGPREAFLLTHVDGIGDLRTLIDVTGMTRLEVSMLIEKLIDLGAIELA